MHLYISENGPHQEDVEEVLVSSCQHLHFIIHHHRVQSIHQHHRLYAYSLMGGIIQLIFSICNLVLSVLDRTLVRDILYHGLHILYSNNFKMHCVHIEDKCCFILKKTTSIFKMSCMFVSILHA